jgi:hypothetical protein
MINPHGYDCGRVFVIPDPNPTRCHPYVHSDYIIRHHHTLLEINSANSTLLHQDVQDIHRVINITLLLILSKYGKANVADKAFTNS